MSKKVPKSCKGCLYSKIASVKYLRMSVLGQLSMESSLFSQTSSNAVCLKLDVGYLLQTVSRGMLLGSLLMFSLPKLGL